MKKYWYRLDNAAKIYPSIITSRTTSVFRLSATLKEFIEPHILSEAVNSLSRRFPFYFVRIRSGVFWHYLEHNPAKVPVMPETQDPCRKIIFKKCGRFLFRVMYFRKKISLEISHIITDGNGGLIFLNALICEYLSLAGIKMGTIPEIYRKSTMPSEEEAEDGYIRYYKKRIPKPFIKETAFHIREKKIDSSLYNILTGIIDIKVLLEKSRSFGISLTEFIVSLYIKSLVEYIETQPLKTRKKILKPIRIMVPVNLRKLYPSRTMRNFFLTVMPGIDPRLGDYTFDEIARIVHHTMRVEIDDKFINQQISRNVGSEKNWLVRLVPLFAKIPAERMLYTRLSAREHSGVITNLGQIDMPEKISRYIERYEFIPNPNPITVKNIGIISYRDYAYISFGSLCGNTDVEKIFFRNLRKMQIQVKIETNTE